MGHKGYIDITENAPIQDPSLGPSVRR